MVSYYQLEHEEDRKRFGHMNMEEAFNRNRIKWSASGTLSWLNTEEEESYTNPRLETSSCCVREKGKNCNGKPTLVAFNVRKRANYKKNIIGTNTLE